MKKTTSGSSTIGQIYNNSGTPLLVGKCAYTSGRELKGALDEVKVTDNKVSCTVDGDEYMHGKHSWKIMGEDGRDAMVAQLLSNEVAEYIRNREVNQNGVWPSASGTERMEPSSLL